MQKHKAIGTPTAVLMCVSFAWLVAHSSAQTAQVRTGAAAFGSWKDDAPGVRRHIVPSDVPMPARATDPEGSIASNVKVLDPPQGALPKVPEGFAVQVFATGFEQPRRLRIAPNGDIFLSESGSGRVLMFRAGAGDTPAKAHVFAEDLDRPFGIVFQPPDNPQYVYVAAANQVVRFPYRNGDLRARGAAETVIANIPTKRHWTRDLAITSGRQAPVRVRRVGLQSRCGWHARADARPPPHV